MATKNHFNYFLLGITVVFLLLRLPQVLRDEFPFVFDMGRDHIWVRNIVELKKPTLVGPWGSLAGVYFGPAWYYLLVPAYIITGGDPRGSVITVMLVNLAALLLGSVFLKKEIGRGAAIVFALLYAFSAQNIGITTYPFHANILPATMVATIIPLYYFLYFLKGKQRYFWIAALASSLNFHFEPATGVFTSLTLITFLVWQRKLVKLKPLIHAGVAFIAPFLPQVLFELRHNFIQSKALILYLQGGNQSLEGKLPFFIRIGERIRKFTELFSSSIIPNLPLIIVGIILATSLIWLLRTKKGKNESSLTLVLLFTLLIPLLGFMFLFPPELKNWYLYGFTVNYFMLTALLLNKLTFRPLILNSLIILSWRKRAAEFLRGVAIILFLFWQGQLHHRVPNLFKSSFSGPEIVATQKGVITTLYQQSEGKPFSAYVYTPPIYDYHYQYLFWLTHKKKGLPLPIEYSYLPEEKSYHQYKEYFLSESSKVPELVYLIIEPETDVSRLQGWLGHFAAYEKVASITLESGITIETRRPSSI